MFKRLTLASWRQFDRVEIDFHPRLTILTGANGAGKTTLLHLLNRHWGWNIKYVSTPRFTKKDIRNYWAGFWTPDDTPEDNEPTHKIGQMDYRDHGSAQLTVPDKVAETFSVDIQPIPALNGVYVPSHRPLYLHKKVESIPTQIDAREQIFNVYLNEIRNRFNINTRVQSPSHQLKQSLVSLATFGYGNRAVAENSQARETFEGFERILRIILPPTLGFQGIVVKVPDVLLQTDSGDFAFDAVSGGVSALIDLAWQVFLYSQLHDEFVVVIDEPEAHLHPELQQRILPNLLEAFGKAQFVVATHNPFVVGSVPDSNVYVLRYTPACKVESILLEQLDKAGTANDILREALGLRNTSALWVTEQLQRIIKKYSERELTQDSLSAIRNELVHLGLDRYIPETLADVVTTDKDYDKA